MTDNVLPLRPVEKKEKVEEAPATDLAAIEERNKKNEERVRKERAQANKSVLRSYRIKS